VDKGKSIPMQMRGRRPKKMGAPGKKKTPSKWETKLGAVSIGINKKIANERAKAVHEAQATVIATVKPNDGKAREKRSVCRQEGACHR